MIVMFKNVLFALLILLTLSSLNFAALIVVNGTEPQCTVGDSFTDNITAAIAAASNGDTIIICANGSGVYNENVIINKSLNISGLNLTTPVIINTTNVDLPIFNVTANNFNISNLTITNNNGSSNPESSGILFDGNNSRFYNLTMVNNYLAITLIGGSNNTIINNTLVNGTSSLGFVTTAGVYLRGVSLINNTNISNNVFSSSQIGIELQSTVQFTTILNNTFQNHSFAGMYLFSGPVSNTILNNTINSSYDGITLDNPSTSNNISFNTIFGSNNSGISILRQSSGNNIFQNTIYNNTQGLGAAIYLYNISSGTNNISNNVVVQNNTYGIFFRNASGMNLSGNNFTLNAYGAYLNQSSNNNLLNNNFSFNNQSGVYIHNNSNSNNISSNTIFNNSIGIYLDRNGAAPTNNILFQNTIFNHTGLSGVGILVNNVTLINNINQNNLSLNNTRGIFLNYSSNINVTNNTITRSNRGIYLDNVNTTNISANTVENSTSYGITLASSYNNNLSSNDVRSSIDFGIDLALGSYNLLLSNSVHSSTGHGIGTGESNTSVINNSMYNNAFSGFYTSVSNNVSLVNNTAYSNQNSGLFVYNSNASVTNDHYYNNTQGDLYAAIDGTTYSGYGISLTDVIFDNPTGSLENYTNLSLSDYDFTDGNYSINWTSFSESPPLLSSSFAQKFIDIEGINGAPEITSITWKWLDSESSSNDETKFDVWYFDDVWADQNAGLDTSANTLTLSDVDLMGIFGIFETNVTPQSSGGNSGSKSDLEIGLDKFCDNSIITVTSGSKKIVGANLFVNGNLLNSKTDSNGQVSVAFACGQTITIKASKVGYNTQSENFDTVSCSLCKAQCTQNSDCNPNQQCSNSMCKDISCSCGKINNHQCTVYECCSDSQCGTNQMCSSNICVDKKECSMDKDCSNSQSCVSGKCTEVIGSCGKVSNHTWVQYECGSGPGCSTCSSGSACSANKCVPLSISCGNGMVGDKEICTAKIGGVACSNCNYEVVSPGGKKLTGQTDASGKFTLSLGAAGNYKVSLLKDGKAQTNVKAEAPETPKSVPPSDNSWLILLLLIIIVIVAIFIFYNRRNKTTIKKK